MGDGRPKTGRRAFLALGAGVLLAGCVRGGGGSGDPTTTMSREPTSSSSASTTTSDQSSATTSETPTTPGTEPGGMSDDPVEINSTRDQAQETATIGDDPSGDGSGTITVWNDAGTTRTVRITISERGGKALLEETYRLDPDAYVEIEVTKAGRYALGVAVDGDEPATIDFRVDTCNSLGVNVAVQRDGTIESTQVSTLVGCRMPTTTNTDD